MQVHVRKVGSPTLILTLGGDLLGVTCWAEQAGEWPLDEHARPTTDHLPWRHSEEKARFKEHPSPCEITSLALG